MIEYLPKWTKIKTVSCVHFNNDGKEGMQLSRKTLVDFTSLLWGTIERIMWIHIRIPSHELNNDFCVTCIFSSALVRSNFPGGIYWRSWKGPMGNGSAQIGFHTRWLVYWAAREEPKLIMHSFIILMYMPGSRVLQKIPHRSFHLVFSRNIAWISTPFTFSICQKSRLKMNWFLFFFFHLSPFFLRSRCCPGALLYVL